MNNNLQVFNFNEHAVRIIMCDGEPWWIAKDVCDVLELADVTSALRGLDDDEKVLRKISGELSSSGNPNMMTINESALYNLIMRSNKPEARRFRKWVTAEVLPIIRKTGRYEINKTPQISLGVLEGAKFILETAGIKDNQLILALDKVYKHYTGNSALEMTGVELPAPEQQQLLTPTEIGRELNLNGRRVNEILAGMGYQHKINGSWEAIGDGINYSIMLDVGKRHSDGTPVRQLKWNTSVIRLVKERL